MLHAEAICCMVKRNIEKVLPKPDLLALWAAQPHHVVGQANELDLHHAEDTCTGALGDSTSPAAIFCKACNCSDVYVVVASRVTSIRLPWTRRLSIETSQHCRTTGIHSTRQKAEGQCAVSDIMEPS